MNTPTKTQYTAFEGARRIAAGDLINVARTVRDLFKTDTVEGVLIFDDTNAHLVDIDFRGTANDVEQRLVQTFGVQEEVVATPAEPEIDAPRGPGRPKLGVIAREVTLLPRHWDWLNMQTGGASVALRKLVEEARRASLGKDRIRLSQNASYRFMSAALHRENDYEEVSRALFAGDRERFDALVANWPDDLRAYLKKLAGPSFEDGSVSDADKTNL